MKKKHCTIIVVTLIIVALVCVTNIFVIIKSYYKEQNSFNDMLAQVVVEDGGGGSFIKRSTYVGAYEVVADAQGYNCSIISGEGRFSTFDKCTLIIDNPGVIKVKIQNKTTNVIKYYEYTALEIKETKLDSNFEYTNVKNCVLHKNTYGGNKREFEGYQFCVTTNEHIGQYKVEDVTCDKENFELFFISFNKDNKNYYGYGCRKTKNNNNNNDKPVDPNVKRKDIYLGVDEIVADKGYKCFIESGDGAEIWNRPDGKCVLTTKKIGVVKVGITEISTKKTTYSEYNVLSPLTDDDTELDSNYKYGNIKKCNIRVGDTGVIKKFKGYDFCVTTDEYTFQHTPRDVTCKGSTYDLFTITFKLNGTTYKGYGCRKLKTEENVEIPKFDSCRSLLGDPTNEKMPAFYIIKAFDVVKYVAIVLLIVMSIFDFVGAAGANNEDSIKKATSKTITRLILCVVIFLLPVLIKFVLKYLNNRAIDLCGL